MKFKERKKDNGDILEIIPDAISTLRKNIIDPLRGDQPVKRVQEKAPFRAELFTEQQMEDHARALAKKHVLVEKPTSEGLLPRLAENEDILLAVHGELTETVTEHIRIVPAAEWLLDNFYLIEEQIYTGKKHLPKGYSRGLPQLAKGPSAGLPRVYDLAVELISHSDGHVDLRMLNHFVKAYQSARYLTLGELWAIPIMLRLALIENLRRLATQISIDINNKNLADKWADQMIDAAENDPKNLVLFIADMARDEPALESSFVAEFTRRLQEKGNALSLPLSWLDQRLAENGTTTGELIQAENQKQAADQVSISNTIGSLRFLSNTDWREFVEENSIIHEILCREESGTYCDMDFHTRDLYRHAVETVAKHAKKEENIVAQMALDLSNDAAATVTARQRHVGYYLVDKGLRRLQDKAGISRAGRTRIKGLTHDTPFYIYAGSILLLTALITWFLINVGAGYGLRTITRVGLTIIVFLAISQLALSVINWLTTILSHPRLLPRMDFSKEIPDASRTMVVIPTMLSHPSVIATLIEGLEIRYLANRHKNLYFALLTDFKDADKEHLDEDNALLHDIIEKINELNRKYNHQQQAPFFLFHRPRRYNSREKRWMGYERKRGKLGDLNALFRGHGKDKFQSIVGDEAIYTTIKYIITLDTDTQLPRDVAWKLAGTLAHPLNKAYFSAKKKRVIDGYTILQPRVSNTLPAMDSSLYARIHGNEPGTDPYTRAISDVYQDLFGEGSFIGKGIYDIDAFEESMEGKFPENRILSHDLLEGSYGRAGLVTDVQLYEEYPGAYITDMLRRHRWVRGDWQIASWITPFVPGANGKLQSNPLSALSKWKIFDNLRRSLVPPAIIAILLYGWIQSSNPVFWTIAVLTIFFLPGIVSFLWQLFRKPKDVIFSQHLLYCFRSLKDTLFQNIIETVCLPFAAWSNVDAIARTLWRVYITRRNLLQWTPFSSSSHDETHLKGIAKRMWIAPLTGIAAFIATSWYSPWSLFIAAPILILWTLSPLVVFIFSRPRKIIEKTLSKQEDSYLRKLARKTWYFFETFVVDTDHYLPPDNFQEAPVERTAHRTSPTNIGLYLLSNLTAYDFGYITPLNLIERVSNTISTLQRMEKFRGHLYNWYDTQTLAPLHPKYISTVDSGNLMGHLITLRQGLMNVVNDRIISERSFEGLIDELRLLQDIAPGDSIKKLEQSIQKNYPARITNLASALDYLNELEAEFTKLFVHTDVHTEEETESEIWQEKIFTHLRMIKTELLTLVPWLILPTAPEKFKAIIPDLPTIPSFAQLSRIEQRLLQRIINCYAEDNSREENDWLNQYRAGITESARRSKEILLRIDQLASYCEQLENMEYNFLFDKTQQLLAIGYNVDEHRRDNSFYDLLASEARLTTFTAIAQGKLPQDSWFALGRQLTNVGSMPILLSWSGSMFEYLMPLLVMPSYENTLLDQTHKAVVQKQIDYGNKKNVPWGISESGYNIVDAHLNWQYKAFGVPGIGFKRGLGEDLVISPYSTVMSLMVDAQASYDNLMTMHNLGFEGKYGFYEAVDYTSSRLPRRQNYVIIKSWMAHHQGMSFLSLGHHLHGKLMQLRFQEDVQVKSALLLLQERIPRITTFYSPTVHAGDISVSPGGDGSMRILTTPDTPIPEVQLLSNGRYDVMVTNSGGGYSKWKNIALTRWREDAVSDDWGTFCYIRDLDNNSFWSSSYQPSLQQGENYEAVFSQGRAEFRRRDLALETHTEIVVSPEDDIELRRVHLVNRSRRKRVVEITTYAEVVLAPAKSDEAHPAFSNLFVQTTIDEARHAILCTRRPRSANEQVPYMFHVMKSHDSVVHSVSYETSRAEFTGRGNTVHSPKVMRQTGVLSNSQGSVLDPIIAIQYRIEIEPLSSATVDMIYGAASTKEAADVLIDKYQDRHLTNRVLELAWTHSQVILRQINAIEADAQLYARLASSIIFANQALRTDPSVIMKNNRGQSGLWGYSISGDLPIVLLQIEDSANIDLVKQLLQAHTYWKLKGLAVDLVIWNEDHGGYRQVLQGQIQSMIAPISSGEVKDKPGGIFIRSADQISNEDRVLFQTVAHIIISDQLGTLEEQINRRGSLKSNIPYFSPVKFFPSIDTGIPAPQGLVFNNEYGGFTEDGKEYVITVTDKQSTPAPWCNVLANKRFGTIISESGQSYTWLENAHEYRLTPWNNDPVSDLKGEAFYIRDEENGKFWSPTPLPTKGKSLYITRHGFGYSVFTHSEDGIETEMTVFTHLELPVKFSAIKIRNNSGRPRKLSVTGYVEWVLGDLRARSLMHIITETDMRSGAILARNPYNTEFEGRVAFFDVDETNKSMTADRMEFLGRNGTPANPDAMNRAKLSGRKGAGFDPCAAIQVAVDLPEEGEKEIVFRLGAGRNLEEVNQVIKSVEGLSASKRALDEVHQYWERTLHAIYIETPDAATNFMANGWLNYQALACRLWARSGFYQSGGAFGFRDQLQDVIAMLHNQPMLAREQILLCASRQFIEGDVQHWWHPPAGRGVRTTCSDDYLWLPFVTSRYVSTTGDTGVLDEQVNFLDGRMLNAGEESYYDLPLVSDKRDTLYEHCKKSLIHGLRMGEHGLPLMGSGDWNDGMDKVGEHGKGESVWLAFFLYDALQRFIPIAQQQKDTAFLDQIEKESALLKQNINTHAWDGAWFRRAYFDDGTPLGTATGDECQIDSIAQSWSVLSGAGDPARSEQAMQSAYSRLVKTDDRIIQLFDPPFDTGTMNPGYIKGYVPGVRENGGQYTHAAIWLIMGFARLGHHDKVWELLQLINPVNHGDNRSEADIYKVEPYVLAADVYAIPTQKGRGGWTWYTGSAGWLYQLLTDYLVGLHKESDKLYLRPCLPVEWPEVKVNYRFFETVYAITIRRTANAKGLTVDGTENTYVPLINDQQPHNVILEIPMEDNGIKSLPSS